MSKIVQLLDKDNKNVYPKVKNDYLLVYLNQRQYINNTTNTKVNFNTLFSSYGDGLEMYNGGIKIGKGIKRIRADLSLWMEAYGNSYSEYHIVKNSSNMTTGIFPLQNGGEVWRSVNSFAYIDVNEGDVIYGFARFSIANSSNNIAGNYVYSCTLGVQVIE